MGEVNDFNPTIESQAERKTSGKKDNAFSKNIIEISQPNDPNPELKNEPIENSQFKKLKKLDKTNKSGKHKRKDKGSDQSDKFYKINKVDKVDILDGSAHIDGLDFNDDVVPAETTENNGMEEKKKNKLRAKKNKNSNKASKSEKEENYIKGSKDIKDDIISKDNSSGKDSKDLKESRESKDTKETKNTKETKMNKEVTKDNKESKDTKESTKSKTKGGRKFERTPRNNTDNSKSKSKSRDKKKKGNKLGPDKLVPQNNSTNTNSNTISDTGHSNSIPFHEAKPIKVKFERGNEMLNFTMDSTVRAINKMPKGRYGYVEDYDLIKAEKFLSKRRVDKDYYDKDFIYGKPSRPSTQVNSESSSKPLSSNNMNGADSEKFNELNPNDLKGSHHAASRKTEEEDEKEGEKEDEKEDVKDEERKDKKSKGSIKQTRLKNKNKPNRTFNQINRHNVNFDIYNKYENDYYNQNNLSQIKEQESEYANNGLTDVSNDASLNLIKENNDKYERKRTNDEPKNKNFELLFGEDTEEYKEFKENNEKNEIPPNSIMLENMKKNNKNTKEDEETDMFSCPNCEPIYKLSIMHNIPLKVLKCLQCGNVLNNTSLQFYLKKYKDELLLDLQSQKNKKDKCADERGIGSEWGNWVDSNNRKIREDNLYKIINGQIPIKDHQKDIIQKDIIGTPYEEMFRKKNRDLFNTLGASGSSKHKNNLENSNNDFYTKDGLNYINFNEENILEETRKKVPAITRQLEQDALVNQMEHEADNDNDD